MKNPVITSHEQRVVLNAAYQHEIELAQQRAGFAARNGLQWEAENETTKVSIFRKLQLDLY